MALDVLLIEPYHGGSHRAWADGLVAHSAHQVALLAHDGAFWRWRMQGAAATLAVDVADHVRRHGRPEVALVSSMVDLPALLGLARPHLDGVPVVLYLHENQLTYPQPEGRAPDLTYALTSWRSLLAADRAVFNSEHHRRDLLDALPGLLGRFPDHRHTGLLDGIEEKTSVLPVGIDLDRFAGPRLEDEQDPPLIVWNHRWEYDKGPEVLARAVDALAGSGRPFRLALAGQRFTRDPEPMAGLLTRHADRLAQVGRAEGRAYPDLLRRAAVALSTAHHEFFGVAMAEAMAAGACPLAPRGLSYPELVAPDLHATCLYRDEDELASRLGALLDDGAGRRRAGRRARADVARFSWSAVAPRYDELLAAVAAAGPAAAAGTPP